MTNFLNSHLNSQKKMKHNHNHNQIECPNCGSAFELNKNKFASILSQVKENEIDRQVSEKVRIFQDKIDSESKLAINKSKSEHKDSIDKLEKALSIEKLKNQEQLKNQKNQIDLAVEQSKNSYQKEINKINSDKKDIVDKLEKALSIEKLKNQEQLKNQSTQIELEREKTKNVFEKDKDQKIEKISSQYKQEIVLLEEEVARLKDFQSKLSTKMIGETLEQHCQIEFDLRQADGCFPNAELVKDNNVVNGTKGDFIFKDYDEDGNEIISVMLEMKNQSDIGNIKKKNSDHYSKLNKDKTNKNCDYAILVSNLEPDNDFFNRGIIQVREFKNMYVVRPNSLLILLSFITSFARKTLDEKREIAKLKSENLELTNFEDNLANFTKNFQINSDRVAANFAKSIVEIDKIIAQLEKHKSTLQKIDSNFQIANRKAQEITVKKLTYKNTFMQKVFQKIREEKKNA
tara:strand:+ start:941 stop:2320 length:1380 start_codon:yes stop_codon:yes gene_type:complete